MFSSRPRTGPSRGRPARWRPPRSAPVSTTRLVPRQRRAASRHPRERSRRGARVPFAGPRRTAASRVADVGDRQLQGREPVTGLTASLPQQTCPEQRGRSKEADRGGDDHPDGRGDRGDAVAGSRGSRRCAESGPAGEIGRNEAGGDPEHGPRCDGREGPAVRESGHLDRLEVKEARPVRRKASVRDAHEHVLDTEHPLTNERDDGRRGGDVGDEARHDADARPGHDPWIERDHHACADLVAELDGRRIDRRRDPERRRSSRKLRSGHSGRRSPGDCERGSDSGDELPSHRRSHRVRLRCSAHSKKAR